MQSGLLSLMYRTCEGDGKAGKEVDLTLHHPVKSEQPNVVRVIE